MREEFVMWDEGMTCSLVFLLTLTAHLSKPVPVTAVTHPALGKNLQDVSRRKPQLTALKFTLVWCQPCP